jgi:hypothetical protein
MRFFIDTEFTSDAPGRLELISIAFAAEDGSEFYAVSSEFDEGNASDWVRANVLPQLEPRDDPAWMTRDGIRDGLVAFVGERATELWGRSPAYDMVLLHGLFGGWGALPQGWPWHCWDLKQWSVHLGLTELPDPPERAHHALVDARHQRDLFTLLHDVARGRRGAFLWPPI